MKAFMKNKTYGMKHKKALASSAMQGSNATPKKQRTLKRFKTNTKSEIISNSTLYPNPASDIVTIDLAQYINLSIVKVYNLEGKIMFEQNLNGLNKMTIDVNSFSNGTYTVQFIDNCSKQLGTTKFEVVHIK